MIGKQDESNLWTVLAATVVLTEAQKLELKLNIQKYAKTIGIPQDAVTNEIFPRSSNEEKNQLGMFSIKTTEAQKIILIEKT